MQPSRLGCLGRRDLPAVGSTGRVRDRWEGRLALMHLLEYGRETLEAAAAPAMSANLSYERGPGMPLASSNKETSFVAQKPSRILGGPISALSA